MNPEFSEFTYGYCVIREYESKIGEKIRFLPLIPSLRKEKYIGYDVKLVANKNIFLQFKIAQFLKSRKAREWNYFKQPYYRYEITAPQLFNLSLLSSLNKENIVRYVSPVFFKKSDLDRHYTNEKVMEHSIFIPPERIISNFYGEKIMEFLNERHYIGYYTNRRFTIFSKPIEIELSDVVDKNVISSFVQDLKYLSFIDFLKYLQEATIEFVNYIIEKYTTVLNIESRGEYIYTSFKFIRYAKDFAKTLSMIEVEEDAIEKIITLLYSFYTIHLNSQLYIAVDYSKIDCECTEVSEDDGMGRV